MTVRDAAWWPSFLERLRDEPLEELAAEHGADPAALEAALAEASQGQSVTDSAWWPEAVRRIEAGGSLRAVARSFQTNPRRIRRGMARAGIRVGGSDVTEGNPELAGIRARLGKEPDGDLAEAAGVSLEAIKGERRRLGIEAYRPPPRDPSPREPSDPLERALLEEEAGGKGPGRPKVEARPRRPRVVEVPQIIRRPRSSSASRRLPTIKAPVPLADAAEPAPEADKEDRGGRRRIVRDSAASASLESRRKARRGRTRIVRRDEGGPGEDVDEPEQPAPSPRRRRSSPHGRVRVVDPGAVSRDSLTELVNELIGEGEGPAPVLPTEPSAPAAPSEVEVEVEVEAEGEESTVPHRPSRGDDAPPRNNVLAFPDRGRASRSPAARVAPREAAQTAPARLEPAPLTPPVPEAEAEAETEPAAAGPDFGWEVRVAGHPKTWFVVAPDVGTAAALAGRALPPELLGRASISRIGPVLSR